MNIHHKAIYKVIALLCVVLVSAACSKDLGNYDYQDVNELEISGVEDEYPVRTGIDTLRIQPDINATMDEGSDPSRYEHVWVLRMAPTVYDTLSREKDLIYPVRLDPADYGLFYRLKDTQTGVTWIANTELKVSTAYSRGWLIMGEDEQGNAEAEMLSMINDTVHIRNILSLSGLPALTGPISLLHTGGSATDRKVWAMTEDGTFYLDRATMRATADNTFSRITFMSEAVDPETMHPVALASQIRTAAGANGGTYYRAVVTNGGDVFASMLFLTGGDFYNNPVNRLAPPPAARIPAAPFLLYPIGSMSTFIWYDTQNDRFLNFANIGIATTSVVLPDGNGDVFPWDQPAGRTLVYAENTRNTDGGSTNGNSFAIMKDSDGTHHVYKFYANGTNPAKRAAYTVKSMATDFGNADFYAFSSNRSVIFYSVGNKLYAYDYNPGFEKIYTFPEVGSDAITMVKFDTQVDHVTNSLYVATYNPTDKGTLRRFIVGTDPNVVELLPQENSTWTGLVKVKDINWRAVN